MQLKLTLSPVNSPFNIPRDYAYLLSSAIYSIIQQSDKKFAKFLHNTGWKDGYKSFKFYTFGRLHGLKRTSDSNQLLCHSSVTLRFHSAHPEVINHVVMGMFSTNKIKLMGYGDLEVQSVESLPESEVKNGDPVFCYTRSPIIIHTQKDEKKWALSPADSEWSEFIRNNLLEKWKTFHGTKLPEINSDFSISVDHEIWKEKQYGMVRTRVGKDGFSYRGSQLPVTFSGNPDLIKFGINTGIGEMNAMGFGCLEAKV